MAHESQLLARGTPPSSKPRPKARGKPPRRKGHGDGGKKGKGRSCGLPRKFGPHEQLLSHLPTYRSSHPSHLLTSLLPDVSPYLLFLPFANRTCAQPHAVSSLPAWTRGHAARSTIRSCTRTNAAHSTRLDDVDLDFPQQPIDSERGLQTKPGRRSRAR